MVSRGEETRRRILSATGVLLEAAPGAHVSMSDVASAAGVTRQLLYFHFQNRTALLLELSRLIDAEARTPELQARIDGAPDACSAMRAAVSVQAEIKSKIHGVATSLELLRPTDDAAAAACEEREAARLDRCRAVIDRLAAERRLHRGWDREAAAELMWSMTSLRAWDELVHRGTWSGAQWARRTAAALEAALVEVDRAGSASAAADSGTVDARGG